VDQATKPSKTDTAANRKENPLMAQLKIDYAEGKVAPDYAGFMNVAAAAAASFCLLSFRVQHKMSWIG
jgi:hypothetical protein